ncbi:hypothetical protein BU197_19045 [Streptomyces sp. CBMA291]|nr:hypothetical protein [Streptomyces sp. CBMA291]MBD0712730.1 hypothetical protein [Streptomyces sp. CBMA370]
MALTAVLGTASTAGATPAVQGQGPLVAPSDPTAPPVYGNRTVWKTVNHRLLPNSTSQVLGQLSGGVSYPVSCWKRGQSVTAEGITNNVWILVKRGTVWGYASAIYFSGNAYADLPASAECSLVVP